MPARFGSGWVTWDLTALAQARVDGMTTNSGILVKSNVTDEMEFLTKENNSGAGAFRPQLVVVYQ